MSDMGFKRNGPYDRNHHPFEEPWTSSLLGETRLFSIQLFCFGGSTMITRTCCAPLERTKILLQVQHMRDGKVQYGKAQDAWKQVIKSDGYKGLWKGNGVNVARVVPDVIFRFLAANQFAVLFTPIDGGPLSPADKLRATSAAGALRTMLFYPLDVCRIRITTDGAFRIPGSFPSSFPSPSSSSPSSSYPFRTLGLIDTASSIVRREGVRALYRGAASSSILAALQVVLIARLYELLDKAYLPPNPDHRITLESGVGVLAFTTLASLATHLALHPLDTARRCVQVSEFPRHRLPSSVGSSSSISATGSNRGEVVSYASLGKAVRDLLRSQGPMAFFRGALPGAVGMSMAVPLQVFLWDALHCSTLLIDRTSSVASAL